MREILLLSSCHSIEMYGNTQVPVIPKDCYHAIKFHSQDPFA